MPHRRLGTMPQSPLIRGTPGDEAQPRMVKVAHGVNSRGTLENRR